jgi:hypothetical protein
VAKGQERARRVHNVGHFVRADVADVAARGFLSSESVMLLQTIAHLLGKMW